MEENKRFKNNKVITLISLCIILAVSVVYLVRDYSSIFSAFKKTITFISMRSDDTKDEDISSTIEGDASFSKVMSSIYDKYPWYKNMPINTDGYFIVWDLEKSQFRIRLKASSESSQSNKDALLSEALRHLKSVVNEDFSNYQYYVLYSD